MSAYIDTCEVADCERPRKTRGMCGMHAERVRAGIPLDMPPRNRFANASFADLFVTSSNCWTWQGVVNSEGYGIYRRLYAHRVSYAIHVGPIPDGLQIDHLCRNRLCVNPGHLEAVTQRVNILRGTSPGATAVRTNRCKRGHEFTPENTYVRPDGRGRQCRECNRLRDRRGRSDAA